MKRSRRVMWLGVMAITLSCVGCATVSQEEAEAAGRFYRRELQTLRDVELSQPELIQPGGYRDDWLSNWRRRMTNAPVVALRLEWREPYEKSFLEVVVDDALGVEESEEDEYEWHELWLITPVRSDDRKQVEAWERQSKIGTAIPQWRLDRDGRAHSHAFYLGAASRTLSFGKSRGDPPVYSFARPLIDGRLILYMDAQPFLRQWTAETQALNP